jgi:hypothetical protein
MAVIYFDLYVTDSTVASGSPGKTGLTPTFTSLKTTGASPGTDVSSHATVSEIGKGHYQVAYDPETFGEAAGEVDCGSALATNTDRFLPVSFARDSSRIQSGISSAGQVALSSTGLNAIAGFNGWSLPQALRALVAFVVGKRSGMPASGTAGTITYTNSSAGDYGTVTVDTAGNITANAMTPTA